MNKWKGPPHENIPRCGAKTRSGGSCGHYSMPNGRCRYHGGKSTGAKNPEIKHGMYTKAAIEERKWMNQLLKDANELASEINVISNDKVPENAPRSSYFRYLLTEQ